MELTASQRGLLRIPYLHLSSIFPLGLFRKGMRFRVDQEFLVYPRLLPLEEYRVTGSGPGSDHTSQRPGSGHELLALRAFRQGDDRRGIHWKQSARTGELIFLEREAERGRRVSLLVDNGVGQLTTQAQHDQFERAISEAATAAKHFLGEGYAVELITRGEVVGFGHGPMQRRRIFEALALLSPVSSNDEPLSGSDPSARGLSFVTREGGA
jgi:uncharacterized protein (DUF58 family)